MDIAGIDPPNIFTMTNVLVIIIGSLVGLIIGALPGLGAAIAIVLLLPFTYTMEPLASILLLLSAYQSAEYGGSISAIVLGIPGTPAAVTTVLDGHPMAKNESPGKALGYSLIACLIGGIAGGLVLLFLTVPLSQFALNLSNPEFFLIGVIGLLAVAGLSSNDLIKSLIFTVLGLLAGTVGIDMFTSLPRFTFGRPELMEGLSLIAVLIGMYAFSEIFKMINEDLHKQYIADVKKLKIKLPFRELKNVFSFSGIGSIYGAIIGIFPGLGTGISSWLAYSTARKVSKSPETFGKGNPEGIMTAESANNSTVGGALIPLLTLGIPGSPTIAIIMGAFVIHGIQPGPNVFSEEPKLINGILIGFLLTSIVMFIIGLLVTRMFVKVLMTPTQFLIPALLILTLVGVYSSNGMFFELWFAFFTGVICFFMRELDFSFPAFILAFVLSPIIEESLRRTLIISDGSYFIFFERLYSVAILSIGALFIFLFFFLKIRKLTN
ncbi:tripartite tricarboxylate transporter permease [Salibacterium aidingense]|uniref:tripartite tricarboxylate transporter permease n=1 Tax=Salibacterium aidingense TaxID=384933 RepID=UPI003BD7EBF5